MKRTKRLLETAAERLDLPGNIVAGQPKVELTGFSRISVERHRGILEYGDEAVTVALEQGRIRITGKALSITLMNHEYIVVRGRLRGVELTPGDGHA